MQKRQFLNTVGIFCALILAGATVTQARILYVDDDAPPGGVGDSWTTAYRFLQDALGKAETTEIPVEIHVAQGVYKPDTSSVFPDGTGDRTARFYLLDDVTIKGGFAGLDSIDSNLRDPDIYETFLSGDLAGDDVFVPDPRDLYTEPTRAENSYVIVAAESCTRSACLDGFVIQSQNSRGARVFASGVYLFDVNGPCCPSIRNCTVLDCGDGGMLLRGASPELTNCTFTSNAGAIHVMNGEWNASPNDLLIDNCLFADNCTDSDGAAIRGRSLMTLFIENCLFVNNIASSGGAIRTAYEKMVCANCQFLGNKATTGGAIYFGRMAISLDACICVGNRAEVGRAIASTSGTASRSLSITNSILWDGGSEIQVTDSTEVNVTYSDIQGYWLGQGNINVDPCFADPGYWDDNGTVDNSNDDFFVAGDYHLKSQTGRWDPASESWVQDEVTSPCIDAGDPNAPVLDEPVPNGGIINMGAYGGMAEASKSK